MFQILDGYKTHILGGFAIVLGLIKLLTDIPEIEGMTVLGITDAWSLITGGWATIAGRSVVKKLGK